jgi:ubiquinone biosynthesis protein
MQSMARHQRRRVGRVHKRVRWSIDRWRGKAQASVLNGPLEIDVPEDRPAEWIGDTGWRSTLRRAPAELDPRLLEISRPLPRRKSLLDSRAEDVSVTMHRRLKWKTSTWQVIKRLLVWNVAIVTLLIANSFDRLFYDDKRGGVTRRRREGIRLRHAMERMGGSMVKIGQQAAMRMDLLPPEYCDELSKMLDKVPPFASKTAVEIIERSTGKPLPESFEVFDPKPIGSASVSCVYQAVRHGGQRVAVKVRRPGIGEVFMADTRAMEWMLRLVESLTLLRPGMSRNMVIEFRTMLAGELDFVREARHTELFRREAKKARLEFVTAPKVHFDLSNEEVLVTDFVTGVWMTELVGAVERKDEEVLEYLRLLRISPKRVARRLMAVNQFNIFDNLLFHADPHPANILVQPDSELVFIDFGACGAYTERERHVWRRLLDAHYRNDVGDMVECALAVLEPLPPIDIDEFSKRVEGVFWQDLYAFRSKHAEWWEHTSASIWLSFLQLAQEYSIPMNLNTLMMIRSSLLYDTIAARLYSDIDAYHEHRVYIDRAGARARKRVLKLKDRVLTKGPPKPFWLRLEHFFALGEKILYLTQRFVDDPPYKSVLHASKLAEGFGMFITMGFTLVVGAVVVMGIYQTLGIIEHGLAYNPLEAFYSLVSNNFFWIWVGVEIIRTTRKLKFRLSDVDD